MGGVHGDISGIGGKNGCPSHPTGRLRHGGVKDIGSHVSRTECRPVHGSNCDYAPRSWAQRQKTWFNTACETVQTHLPTPTTLWSPACFSLGPACHSWGWPPDPRPRLARVAAAAAGRDIPIVPRAKRDRGVWGAPPGTTSHVARIRVRSVSVHSRILSLRASFVVIQDSKHHPFH